MRMRQPNPISVRPRKGSDLEQVWEQAERDNRAMGDYIHSWASTFKQMARREEDDA